MAHTKTTVPTHLAERAAEAHQRSAKASAKAHEQQESMSREATGEKARQPALQYLDEAKKQEVKADTLSTACFGVVHADDCLCDSPQVTVCRGPKRADSDSDSDDEIIDLRIRRIQSAKLTDDKTAGHLNLQSKEARAAKRPRTGDKEDTRSDPWGDEQARMQEFAAKCLVGWNTSSFPGSEKPVWVPRAKPDGF